jgi:hypothetical protein
MFQAISQLRSWFSINKPFIFKNKQTKEMKSKPLNSISWGAFRVKHLCKLQIDKMNRKQEPNNSNAVRFQFRLGTIYDPVIIL